MRILNEARGKFGFKNAWIYDKQILYKDKNDRKKIKIYYEQNLFRGTDGCRKYAKKNQTACFLLPTFFMFS